jgi:tagaturonate epimerase
MKSLGEFSIGVGDRFAHQAKAQLEACILGRKAGVDVIPVWNKSNREHAIIGSNPSSVRAAADLAVKELGWKLPWYCDADHINLSTVDRFLAFCDFYTIDVADYIGKPAEQNAIDGFVKRHPELAGTVPMEGAGESIEITPDLLRRPRASFCSRSRRQARSTARSNPRKGKGTFIPEVSMDETDAAQTPAELLIILAAIADEGIPVQTIAPKFSGRFNKGVDYVGDAGQFAREMELDMAAIRLAVKSYGLPANLKLSVHSGSDKFSIYPAIHASMKKFSTGVHLKTAGTNWLEELIGLAEAGGDGLALAKEIYAEAYAHADELCAPYATVIDIDRAKLPSPKEVKGWSSAQYTGALRHDPHSPQYNSSFRQLLHVGFKVAANMGGRYLALLEANEAVIARNVTENLYARHIVPVFLGGRTDV